MRPYETLVVLSTELGDKASELISRFEGVIRDGGGELQANHSWGLRELAYPIKKQSQGHYYLIEYTAAPEVVNELERTMRIADGVIRFMSVQQEHTGLPEPRRREPGRERGDVPLSQLRSRPPAGAATGSSTDPPASSPTDAAKAGPADSPGDQADSPGGPADSPGGQAGEAAEPAGAKAAAAGTATKVSEEKRNDG